MARCATPEFLSGSIDRPRNDRRDQWTLHPLTHPGLDHSSVAVSKYSRRFLLGPLPVDVVLDRFFLADHSPAVLCLVLLDSHRKCKNKSRALGRVDSLTNVEARDDSV